MVPRRDRKENEGENGENETGKKTEILRLVETDSSFGDCRF